MCGLSIRISFLCSVYLCKVHLGNKVNVILQGRAGITAEDAAVPARSN